MSSNAQQKKHLRALGHKLKPVVTVAQKGVTDAIVQELQRALNDHELIKVKVAAGSREDRDAVTDVLVDTLGAECIQQIGRILLLYRPAPRPDPRLSNLLRKLD